MNILVAKQLRLKYFFVNNIQLQNQKLQKRFLFIHQWKSFKRWQDFRRDNKEFLEEKSRIENSFRLNDDLFISPERPEQGLIILCFLIFLSNKAKTTSRSNS